VYCAEHALIASNWNTPNLAVSSPVPAVEKGVATRKCTTSYRHDMTLSHSNHPRRDVRDGNPGRRRRSLRYRYLFRTSANYLDLQLTVILTYFDRRDIGYLGAVCMSVSAVCTRRKDVPCMHVLGYASGLCKRMLV
jgi:hypothetical protein